MMKKLVKEVPFGKAMARVTVTMFTDKKYLDGIETGEEVITTTQVEIVANGKVVAKGDHAVVLEYNDNTDTYFAKLNLDVTKKYTRVGDKAMTQGEEAGHAINKAIEEMKDELAKEFGVETEEEKQTKAEIEEAQVIIEQAEKEGIENLMSAEEIKKWSKRYNEMYNEGGEGYIPVRVSKESYMWALNVVERGDM